MIENRKRDTIREMIVKPRIESDHFPVVMYVDRRGSEASSSKIIKKRKKGGEVEV